MKTLLALLLFTAIAHAEWVVVFQDGDTIVMKRKEAPKPSFHWWGQSQTNFCFTNQIAPLSAVSNHPNIRVYGWTNGVKE